MMQKLVVKMDKNKPSQTRHILIHPIGMIMSAAKQQAKLDKLVVYHTIIYDNVRNIQLVFWKSHLSGLGIHNKPNQHRRRSGQYIFFSFFLFFFFFPDSGRFIYSFDIKCMSSKNFQILSIERWNRKCECQN